MFMTQTALQADTVVFLREQFNQLSFSVLLRESVRSYTHPGMYVLSSVQDGTSRGRASSSCSEDGRLGSKENGV